MQKALAPLVALTFVTWCAIPARRARWAGARAREGFKRGPRVRAAQGQRVLLMCMLHADACCCCACCMPSTHGCACGVPTRHTARIAMHALLKPPCTPRLASNRVVSLGGVGSLQYLCMEPSANTGYLAGVRGARPWMQWS